MIMGADPPLELFQLSLPALVELGEYALLRGASSLLVWLVVLVATLHLLSATHARVYLLVFITLQNKGYMLKAE